MLCLQGTDRRRKHRSLPAQLSLKVQMSMSDEITKEKQRVAEALARVDAQRERLSSQLKELEATERVLGRYGRRPRARKTASAQTTTPYIEDHARRVIEPSMTAHKETEAGMSFIITKAQKTELRRLGYSEEQIREMKPEDAHRALGLIS